MIQDLVMKNRSFRRFQEDFSISEDTLRQLVELARFSPSGANLQPLKFILSRDRGKNALIFPHLAWAGYLRDWDGPEEGERPSAYIIILGDRELSKKFGCDHGIAAQSMLLGAAEKELGGCMIGSIDREGLRNSLGIPEKCEILLILALGKPAERVVLETTNVEGDIKYWRDEEGIHHVPKRPLDELILE